MNQLTLEQEIFGKLLVVANQIQRFGNQVTKPLTLKQWLLLTVLINQEDDAPTIQELAAVVGSSRQNVSTMAHTLTDKGYLTLEEDPSDRRASRVSVTHKGLAALTEVSKVGNQVLAELFAGLEDQALATTANTINCLLDRTTNR